jgi:hypothetical protein
MGLANVCLVMTDVKRLSCLRDGASRHKQLFGNLRFCIDCPLRLTSAVCLLRQRLLRLDYIYAT